MKRDYKDDYSHWLDTSGFYGWRQLLVSIVLLLGTVFLLWVGYKEYVL